MKITKEEQPDNQVRLKVELEPELMENAKRRAAKKIARTMKIPGFRPGKAPYHIILRHVGEGAIIEEGMELLVQDVYPKVIEDAEIEPYGPGILENVVSIEPPVLEFIIPLEAEVELGDYKSIQMDYAPGSVDDEEIDHVVSNLQEQYATLEPVERPAREGDLASVKLIGKRSDSETEKKESESKDTTLFPERTFQLLIQPEDEEDDWPFPGFTNNLIGMDIGETKEINYKYPEDHKSEALQNVNVVFDISIEDIKARILPEINDDFAETVGDYSTLEDLRNVIHESLEKQKLADYNEEYDDAILTELIDISEIKYPPQMLDRQINNLIDNLTYNLEQQKLDLDLYLKTRDLTLEELREETKPVAEKRLKRTLALLELAKQEDIQIDFKQLERETEQTMQNIRSSIDIDRQARAISQDEQANITANLAASMLGNQAMDRFREIAKGIQLDKTTQTDDPEELNADDNDVANADSEPVVDESIDDTISETSDSNSEDMSIQNE